MNPVLVTRLEKALVVLLAVSFTLPMLLWVLLLPAPFKAPATAWLRNRTLSGAQVKIEPVALTRSNLLSAGYQTALARNFDAHFIGREMFIRVLDEIYLRALHTIPIGQIVGPRLSLIEPAYTEEYCLRRGKDDALRPLVDDLRRLQDFCAARHTPFALVITPSKAAIYPETLPTRWLERYNPAPRYYDLFLPLLWEKGIHYVDGHRLTAGMKPAAQVPLFPLGGIHWSQPAALATGNALLELLAAQGFQARPIRDYRTTFSNTPMDQDKDLANLINVVFTWHYPVATVTVPPVPLAPHTYRPNMVVVGGSFTWKMLELLDDSRQFSELDLYFYYRSSQRCRTDGEWHEIGKPTPFINFATDVFAADALVLEVNEQVLYQPAPHLVDFLHDALAALPDPQETKPLFHYENRLEYQWGDKLFLTEGNRINLGASKGLTPSDKLGSYTFGSLASLRLVAPPPVEDMVLEADAGAYYIGNRLSEQRVQVSANGHPVGEWIWQTMANAHRELTIPKEFLQGGEVLLEFHIAHPLSPSELGQSRESRQFGIHISSLWLHAPGR